MAMHQKAAVQAVTARAAEKWQNFVNTTKATFNGRQKSENSGKCSSGNTRCSDMTVTARAK